MRHPTLTVLLITGALAAPALAEGPTRKEMLSAAASYAGHSWTMSKNNITGTCTAKGYASDYKPGAQTGLPYAWGGFMSLEEFDRRIKAGYGAGSHSRHGVMSCVAGLDCSGLVSRVWGLDTKHGTSTLSKVARAITLDELQPGDALNKAGSHVVLWAGRTDDGQPIIYEASGYHSRVRLATPGWKYLSGYTPIRLTGLREEPAPTASSEPEAPAEEKAPSKEAELVDAERTPVVEDNAVLLRFGQDVGFEPAAADVLAIGPDYLTAREDGAVALYDRVRRRAIILQRSGERTAFEVGHADGISFAPKGGLLVLDGSIGEVRIYSRAGKQTRSLRLPPGLPVGPSLSLSDGRVYATDAEGKQRVVAELVDGKLRPARPGRSPVELPEVFGDRGIRIGGKELRFARPALVGFRLIGNWIVLELVDKDSPGSLKVQRVARHREQLVRLPAGDTGAYNPFADVASAGSKSLVYLDPQNEGVKVVWVDVK